MKKYKVKTPNDSFAGERHGVTFYRGEAEGEFTDQAVEEMKSWGYEVEEIKEKKEAPKKTPQRKTTAKK
jgi:hypothetical protein